MSNELQLKTAIYNGIVESSPNITEQDAQKQADDIISRMLSGEDFDCKELEEIGVDISILEDKDYEDVINILQGSDIKENKINNADFVNSLDEDTSSALINVLEGLVNSQQEVLTNTKDNNGILAKGWDRIKNKTGIGAGSDKTQNKIDELNAQIEKVKNGEMELSEVYKNVTGNDLTFDELASLYAGTADFSNSEIINSVAKYQQGGKQATNTISTIASALTIVALTTAGIVATPFTGGMSLAASFAALGTLTAAGTAAYMAPQVIDGVTEKDGYSPKELAQDTATGIINSAMTATGIGAGKAIGGALTSTATTQAGKLAATFAANEAASLIIGDGVAVGDYLIETGFNENLDFSFKDLGITAATATAGSLAAGGANFATSTFIRPVLTSGSSAQSQVIGRLLASGISGSSAGLSATTAASSLNYLISCQVNGKEVNFDEWLEATSENAPSGLITGFVAGTSFEAVQIAIGTPAPNNTAKVKTGVTEDGFEYKQYLDKDGKIIAIDANPNDIKNILDTQSLNQNNLAEYNPKNTTATDNARVIRFTFDTQSANVLKNGINYQLDATRIDGIQYDWADNGTYLGSTGNIDIIQFPLNQANSSQQPAVGTELLSNPQIQHFDIQNINNASLTVPIQEALVASAAPTNLDTQIYTAATIANINAGTTGIVQNNTLNNLSPTINENKTEVRVFNDLLVQKDGINMFSPEFNGCEGVAVVTDNEVFFAHFPPFCKSRMINSIQTNIDKMANSKNAKIYFVTPTDSQGNIPSEFEEYTSLINGKFENMQAEYLKYPNRSRGKTYCFNMQDNNGQIEVSLEENLRDLSKLKSAVYEPTAEEMYNFIASTEIVYEVKELILSTLINEHIIDENLSVENILENNNSFNQFMVEIGGSKNTASFIQQALVDGADESIIDVIKNIPNIQNRITELSNYITDDSQNFYAELTAMLDDSSYQLAKYLLEKNMDIESVGTIASELNYTQVKTITDFINKFDFSNIAKEDIKIISSVNNIQNTEDQEIKTIVLFKNSEGNVVNVTQTITPQNTTYQRAEYYQDGSITNWNADGTDSFITEAKASIEGQNRVTTNQVEIIYDDTKQPVSVIHKKASNDIYGVYETIEYNLADYPADYDVIAHIQDGTIQGGKPLTTVSIGEDGSKTYTENIVSNGSTIERNYTISKDETKYNYSYKITDNKGNTTLDLTRSFEQMSLEEKEQIIKKEDFENLDEYFAKLRMPITRTLINGEEYLTTFDINNRTIEIKSPNEKITTIDFEKLTQNQTVVLNIQGEEFPVEINNTKDDIQALWYTCKKMPADLLLDINNYVNHRGKVKDLNSETYTGFGILNSGYNVQITAHEIGHQKSSAMNLYNDENLIGIYNKEIEMFNSKYTNISGQNAIQYFSQTGGGNASTGLDELIAETNMLLTDCRCNNFSIQERSQLLAQNFPETISYIAQKLNSSDAYTDSLKPSNQTVAITPSANFISPKIDYQEVKIADGERLNTRIKENPNIDPAAIKQLSQTSYELSKQYNDTIAEAVGDISERFADLQSVKQITSRGKGENSIFEKLVKSYKKGNLTSTNISECYKYILDAYGTRIQIKELSSDDVINTLNEQEINCSYEQLCEFMDGNYSNLSQDLIDALNKSQTDIINSLKEKQSQEIVDRLIQEIKKGENGLIIDEINNYGDDITSYFTSKQIKDIIDAYYETYDEQLLVITKDDNSYDGIYRTKDDTTYIDTNKGLIKSDSAIKDSGYTSAQISVEHILEDGSIGYGEMQIRGPFVNQFAEIEHIPYDIRQGKIKEDDVKYSDIYKTIKSLSDKSYKDYDKYLTDVYKYLRLMEVGIKTTEPKIGDNYFDKYGNKVDVSNLTKEALMKFSH